MNGQRPKPIVVVTGANGGIGFAVCQRLIVQLAHKNPPDALPQPLVARFIPVRKVGSDFEEYACDGLTLIMGCRSVKKAEAAREDLFRFLDEEIVKQKSRKDYDGHAERFKANLEINVHCLDLASTKSVFKFGEEIHQRYPYVSHLVCNAGLASFTGYDWLLCAWQMLTEPVAAVTAPKYKLQRKGEMSEDGLGWVWQCNVFGHYVLFRTLQPLLTRYSVLSSSPARVVWTSSVEALPSCYDPRDWQLIDNDHSYEASKYQTDLLVGYFETLQREEIRESDSMSENAQPPIRHFLSHPGVVKTNIASSSLNSLILEALMQAVFCIVHFLGSTNHTISPFRAAVSAVHLMLVALPFVTVAVPRDASQKQPTPLKFGSQVSWAMKDYVGVTKVEEWDERREQSVDLAEKCEALYQSFLKKSSTSH